MRGPWTRDDELKSIEHLGFAFFGFESSAQPVEELYRWALDWFARLNCVPNKAGANPYGKSDGKYKHLRNLDRTLANIGFEGVTRWCLIAVPEELADRKHGEYFGENMCISYWACEPSPYLVFHVRDALIKDRMKEFMEAAKEACELLHPKYGIGYRRLFRLGPLLFGSGMIQNSVAHPVENNLDYWRDLDRHGVYTLLRDVFPWNFFTLAQLNIKVGAWRLEDWIKDNSSRGTLSHFTDEITLWTVPESAIPALREELLLAGVVFNHKRDIIAKMEEFHVDADVVIEHLKTGKPLVHRPPGPGISEQEMLSGILDAFGDSSSQVFKVEKPGQLREVSKDEIKPPKKNKKKK